MTQRRLLLVIAIVTCLGFITVWQQIQTTRWGYKISEANELKTQMKQEQESLRVQLTSLTSPKRLLTLAEQKDIEVGYNNGTSMVKVSSRIDRSQRIFNRLAFQE